MVSVCIRVKNVTETFDSEIEYLFNSSSDVILDESLRLNDDEEEAKSHMRRLDVGFFILQLVDYVLLEACTGCPLTVKQRVTRVLAQRRASLKTIRHIMREYAGNLVDAGDNEWREAEQQHILQLIDKF